MLKIFKYIFRIKIKKYYFCTRFQSKIKNTLKHFFYISNPSKNLEKQELFKKNVLLKKNGIIFAERELVIYHSFIYIPNAIALLGSNAIAFFVS